MGLQIGLLRSAQSPSGGARWPSATLLMPTGATSTLAMTDQRLMFMPLWVPEQRTTSALHFETTVAGVGGAPVVRLGIYASDANGLPGALLVDAGTVDVTVAPGELTKALTQVLTVGRWWMAAVAQGATVTQPTVRSLGGFSGLFNPTSFGAVRVGYQQASVAGALPATATPVVSSTSPPVVAPMAA